MMLVTENINKNMKCHMFQHYFNKFSFIVKFETSSGYIEIVVEVFSDNRTFCYKIKAEGKIFFQMFVITQSLRSG